MIKESKNLNGNDFFNALVSGITNIISRHEHLNKINVFPVPDGDTGTNLLFTLRPIIQIDESDMDSHFGKTLMLIANMAIDSARGNSGTIMAQYFIGMAENAQDWEELNTNDISKLLNNGFEAAYSAMAEPAGSPRPRTRSRRCRRSFAARCGCRRGFHPGDRSCRRPRPPGPGARGRWGR